MSIVNHFPDESSVDNEEIKQHIDLFKVDLTNDFLCPKLISMHLQAVNKFCLRDDIGQANLDFCIQFKMFLSNLRKQCQDDADSSSLVAENNDNSNRINNLLDDDDNNTLANDSDNNDEAGHANIPSTIYQINERAKAKFSSCFDSGGAFLPHLFCFSIDSEEDEWLAKPTDDADSQDVIKNLSYFAKKLYFKLSFIYPYEVNNQTLQSYVVAFLTKYPKVEEGYQRLNSPGKHANAYVSILLILFSKY